MKTSRSCRLRVAALLICFCAVTVSRAQTLGAIYNFCSQSACNDGIYPLGLLVQGSDGNLYGTTFQGGTGAYGTVFKLTRAGSLTTLANLTGVNGGGQPYAGVAKGNDGNFYGVTTIGGNTPSGCGAAIKVSPSGGMTILHAFTGYPNDACTPWSPLLLANDGNFYGTSAAGGSVSCGGGGCGSVFKMTPSGSVTVLHSFTAGADGFSPLGGLIQGSDGFLYGGTTGAGADNYGTMFKISLSGTLTTLHNFTLTDGYQPDGSLIQGSDGNFYGITIYGGTGVYGGNDAGTVFKMTPGGALTTLYSFCSQPNCADGHEPIGGLVQGADGNFYGTTYLGGATNYGTIFAITPSGSLSKLYDFCSQSNCADGAYPYAGLTLASDGDFYGVTKEGGSTSNCTAGSGGCGIAFKFQVSEDTLAVTVNGSGSVTSTDGFINCPGTCTHIYQHNAQVTLNAAAAGGWTFGTWGGACSGGSPSCTLTMSQNQTVSATFTQLSYQLSVTTSGQGSVTSSDGSINCPGNCTHTYLSNTVVTLNSVPAQGWSLNAWGGACSGNSPTCVVTMTGDATVSAAFTQNHYTLTTSISGQGSITSTDGNINCPGTCTHTYLSLTQVTLNAAPTHGWTFAGWSGACSGTGSCQLTMLGNYGVSAYFIQAGSGLQFSSVTPCRLVDTRQTGQPIQGGTSQNFAIPQLGGCNIPTSASAYSLNVTVVPQGSLGYLTVWPAGLAQPGISTMNSRDGRTKAEAVIVQAGTNDSISIYASNTTNVILDVNGYFGTARLADLSVLSPRTVPGDRHRNPNGELGGPPLIGSQQRSFDVMTSSCMPQGVNIQAYSFNFTVVAYPGGQPLHYLTVWPKARRSPWSPP